MYWTVVDCRSHTNFETYQYDTEAQARDAFDSMARCSVISGWTRTLVLFSDRGKMEASCSLVYHK